MDRATSERMNAKTTKSTECWETPPEVFDALHREFKFDIDLTGGPGTQHRLPIWLGPGGMLPNALTIGWYKCHTDGRHFTSGYSNPPYGPFIPLIMEKAYSEAQHGFTSVFLLPNRVTRWYKVAMRHASEIRIVDERIAFWEDGHPRWNAKWLEKGKQVPDPAMFDSCIVVIRPPLRNTLGPAHRAMFPRADFDLWHWDPARYARCRLTA